MRSKDVTAAMAPVGGVVLLACTPYLGSYKLQGSTLIVDPGGGNGSVLSSTGQLLVQLPGTFFIGGLSSLLVPGSACSALSRRLQLEPIA